MSDYTRLSKDHIVILDGVDFFEIESRKTGRLVTIPIHPQVRDIIETNNGALPSRQPEQIINQNIKVLGALAGINSPVTIEQTIGGRKEEAISKHDLIKRILLDALFAPMYLEVWTTSTSWPYQVTLRRPTS